LQVIEQMLTQPTEDLTALKDNDPVGYAIKVAENMEREKQLQAVRAERESVQAKQVAENQERLKSHIAQEAERLRSAIPDFSDEVKGEVIRKEIRDYAKSVGWSDQELSQVYDHRAVLTLYRAMQFDKLQKSKPAVQKRVAEAPKSLAPGVGSPRLDKDGEMAKKLTKQLKATGRPRDAAKLFERFL
jgi:phage host-nuclease inhibitor protein Gam